MNRITGLLYTPDIIYKSTVAIVLQAIIKFVYSKIYQHD